MHTKIYNHPNPKNDFNKNMNSTHQKYHKIWFQISVKVLSINENTTVNFILAFKENSVQDVSQNQS